MNAIGLYRFGHLCNKKHIPFLQILVKGITFLTFNSVVPYSAEIGKDSKFAYGAIGCVVHSMSVIGERVIIGQKYKK